MKKGNKIWRYFFLAVAVAGGLLLLGEGISMGIIRFLSGGEAASIGIIGGADGPTAIFVTTSGTVLSRELKLVLGTLALLAGGFGYRKMKQMKME